MRTCVQLVSILLIWGTAFSLVFLLLTQTGCQADVTLGVSTKGFYPDNSGGKQVGDPRKPMYQGSGYVERQGGDDYKGFPRMGSDDRNGGER